MSRFWDMFRACEKLSSKAEARRTESKFFCLNQIRRAKFALKKQDQDGGNEHSVHAILS